MLILPIKATNRQELFNLIKLFKITSIPFVI